MLRPARMVHLNVLVMDCDVDRATTQVIKSGLVHVVSVTDLEPWAEQAGLQMVEEADTAAVTEVENMARSIAEKLGVGPEVVSEASAFQPFQPDGATEKLQEMFKEVNSTVAARDVAAQEVATLKQMRSQATRDFRDKLGVDVPSRYTLLEVAIGHLPQKHVHVLKRLLSEVPNVVLSFPEEKGKLLVMAIVLKRDREALQKATEEVGLERIALGERKEPLTEEVMGHLDERIQKAQEELERAQVAVEKCKAAHLPTLQTILSQLTLQKLTRLARSRFRKTARTYLISGWTPRDSRQKVVAGLKKACENRCLIEEHAAEELLWERGEDLDVPILFENPKFLRPFQMLVSTYGRPAYNSIEPTLIVAPTFLLMFGAMFGDVGQGAVLAILGALVSRWKKASEGVRRVSELLAWCGCSAVLFGLLYGSAFGPSSTLSSGLKKLLPYRGFEPIENVGAFLTLALYFGMGMITLGLVLSAIAAIRKRDWASALLDRTGLMGLAFYWLAVAVVMRIFSDIGATGALITVLVLIPVVAAFLRMPLQKLSRPRARVVRKGISGYVLGAVGEALGTYSQGVLMFLSNTLSFLRVAAFAIAHAGLFIAVFSLADVVGGGVALPLLVHIVGNAGMIALEALVVCVQALRLEYYEFFGKFFHAGGREFTPMKLPTIVS